MQKRLRIFPPIPLSFALCGGLLFLASPLAARAQAAQQIVKAAVDVEITSGRNDHSNWIYRDHDVQPGKDEITQTVETPEGSLKRVLIRNGRALSPEERPAENARIAAYVRDSSAQAKRRKANQHDDDQAEELLRMLPTAFIWTVQSETPELITLRFRPSDDFSPPDLQSRVMCAMAGEMIIARNGNRIRTLKGALSHDVKFGFGILGKMFEGGTFDVERREVAPGNWQITETHVHMGGHALVFKTIGQQEDEVKTDWKPSPAKTLREAEALLAKSQ